MKIKGIMEECLQSPEYIDICTKTNDTLTIKIESDITYNTLDNLEIQFSIDDAYLLNAPDIESETRYIYDNAESLMDDFENGVIYKEINFIDDSGTVTVSVKEDDLGNRQTVFTAQWERTDNTENKDDKDNIDNKENAIINANPESQKNHTDNNELIYIDFDELTRLGESPSLPDKLAQVKELEKKLAIAYAKSNERNSEELEI